MGKASELKAYWQLSFYILPVIILGIMALPTKGMAHDIELKFVLISVVFILVIIKSEIDKRRSPALTQFFNHVQSIMIAVMFMIILFGLVFLLGYQFEEWFGKKNSYYPVTIAILYGVVSFLIIRRNPLSVRYAPWILIFPFLVAALVGDFDLLSLGLLIIVAVASALGYYAGRKKAEKQTLKS